MFETKSSGNIEIRYQVKYNYIYIYILLILLLSLGNSLNKHMNNLDKVIIKIISIYICSI